jgi:hypothetical protein
VETDMSLAIVSSVLIAFEQGSVATYLRKVFEVMTSPERAQLPFVLHVCKRHVIEFLRKAIRKWYGTAQQYVKDLLEGWIQALVVRTTSTVWTH